MQSQTQLNGSQHNHLNIQVWSYPILPTKLCSRTCSAHDAKTKPYSNPSKQAPHPSTNYAPTTPPTQLSITFSRADLPTQIMKSCGDPAYMIQIWGRTPVPRNCARAHVPHMMRGQNLTAIPGSKLPITPPTTPQTRPQRNLALPSVAPNCPHK